MALNLVHVGLALLPHLSGYQRQQELKDALNTEVLTWDLWGMLSKPEAEETKWGPPDVGLGPTQGFKEN